MKEFDRTKLLASLKETTEWDIVIIGGGATGLGIAVDSATRGFKTLLLEQEDFAKGTSSRSTKLVHGGVRYLAQGNVSLVKEALKERGLLLKNAPHLTKNETIIIPCYSWPRGLFYTIGLKLYDWLSGKWSIGKSLLIHKKKVIERLPAIKRTSLKCGVLYHDGTFDDARLALNLAQTCVDEGGTTINYCKVISLHRDEANMLNGVSFVDRESRKTYDIKAKVIVNATGVFADDILDMDAPGSAPIIRPSQGIHVVLDDSFLQSKDAIMIPHTDDGRVLFAIPWYENVLVGTTDTPLSAHSLEPRALKSEVDFVLNTAANYFSKVPSRGDVLSVFAGLRPLAATGDNSDKTKEISRSHKVLISKSGLISVIGGKWTTYRKMAEDTLSTIIRNKMLPDKVCKTEHLKIHGYELSPQRNGQFSIYGSDKKGIQKIIETDAGAGISLSNMVYLTKAQVIWAVTNEMAQTVEDVLARRTRILFINAREAQRLAPQVADIMMKELHKDEEWKQNQVALFDQLANGYLLDSHPIKDASPHVNEN